MKKRIGVIVVLLVTGIWLTVALASAQQPQPAPGPQEQPRPAHPPMPMDPLGDAMFPPEMIMQHMRDLGLTDEQKAFMRGEIQKTTTRFNELQWQLQDAMEALHDQMKANPVNEQQALAQLDKVLDAEREIKRLHFGLAISIKNKLTPDQQTKLQGMMHGPSGGPGGPGAPRHPGRPGPGPGGPPPGQEPEEPPQ
jgi:Spy/CpxP family protein refolding chaperone